MDYLTLRKLFVTEIALLFLQFGMGISGNLFVIIPINGSFDFFGYSGGIDVLAHIVNGSLILLFAFLIIWYSYRAKNSLVLKLSGLAVALTITAIACGIVFLESFSFPSLYNVGNDFSMAMAMSFLFVFAIFFSELYITKKAQISS
jgi:hypothetical protein